MHLQLNKKIAAASQAAAIFFANEDGHIMA
jgi:hypothetical protein